MAFCSSRVYFVPSVCTVIFQVGGGGSVIVVVVVVFVVAVGERMRC